MRIILLTLCLALSACGPTSFLTGERPRLNIQDPPALEMRDVNWIVISKENIEQYLPDILAGNLTLIAVTPQGYENVAVNSMATLNYIKDQKAVLVAYRSYYEPQ